MYTSTSTGANGTGDQTAQYSTIPYSEWFTKYNVKCFEVLWNICFCLYKAISWETKIFVFSQIPLSVSSKWLKFRIQITPSRLIFYVEFEALYAPCTISMPSSVCHVSYSMSNVKLYVLCPISMSSKVCHVPYSVSKAKLHATCTISMSNTVCHVSFHVELEASCLMHHTNV